MSADDPVADLKSAGRRAADSAEEVRGMLGRLGRPVSRKRGDSLKRAQEG